MIFVFLSVVAICSTALFGFKLYLGARPTITRAEFEALKTAHNTASRALTTVANKIGLSASLHKAE